MGKYLQLVGLSGMIGVVVACFFHEGVPLFIRACALLAATLMAGIIYWG